LEGQEREKKIKLKVKETGNYMNDITCKENGINKAMRYEKEGQCMYKCNI
jgi:hypothetical protein